jgi:hypothetical protein
MFSIGTGIFTYGKLYKAVKGEPLGGDFGS